MVAEARAGDHTSSNMKRFSLLALLSSLLVACSGEPGSLLIRVVDEAGRPSAARVELLDASGASHVAGDALPIKLECGATPPPQWLDGFTRTREIEFPYTGMTQFYVDGAV